MHHLARVVPAMLAIGWYTWALGASPALGQILFTQVFNPNRVTTDVNGNVFIQHDTGSQNVLTQFAPNGVPVASIAIGGFLDLGLTGRLVTEPVLGLIFYLTQFGLLLLLSPDTLQFIGGADLRAIPPDASAVYDVGTGTVLYPKVLPSSTLSTAGTTNLPRGVTVNRFGAGFTTLPAIPVPVDPFGSVFDSYVFFSPDMEPDTGPLPTVGQVDFTSRGMSSDNAGNFYVATGSVGTSLCGVGGSGALFFLSAGFDSARCLTLRAAVADSRDVAVSPGLDRAYMTLASGQVVFFPLQ
jgi:hypothetical protein